MVVLSSRQSCRFLQLLICGSKCKGWKCLVGYEGRRWRGVYEIIHLRQDWLTVVQSTQLIKLPDPPSASKLIYLVNPLLAPSCSSHSLLNPWHMAKLSALLTAIFPGSFWAPIKQSNTNHTRQSSNELHRSDWVNQLWMLSNWLAATEIQLKISWQITFWGLGLLSVGCVDLLRHLPLFMNESLKIMKINS